MDDLKKLEIGKKGIGFTQTAKLMKSQSRMPVIGMNNVRCPADFFYKV
jgi:hypothetical protein